MKALLRLFSTVHALMALLFACAALVLIAIAARIGWAVVAAGLDRAAAQGIIEAVGLLAAGLSLFKSRRPLLRKKSFVTLISVGQHAYADFCHDSWW